MTPPIRPPRLDDEYLAEMEAFAARAGQFSAMRAPEFYRAVAYLLDLLPEVHRLRALASPPTTGRLSR